MGRSTDINNRIKISVILPVYNVDRYLDRCLLTVVSQTMDKSEYEIILVDDGSKDRSSSICDDYSSKHESIKVIHQENGGAAAARNAGLEIAVGEYVAFVDPDDYIEPDYLEIAYNLAKENEADIAIFDAYREETASRTRVRKLRHAKEGFVTTDKDDITSMQCQILYPYMAAKASGKSFYKDIPLSAPWDKCYRRQFLIDNDLKFPENLKVLDDMSFNFVAFGKTSKIAYIPKPLYHYCIIKDSITNSFKENRPELDMQVFEYIASNIQENGMSTKRNIKQAYYARIIKSFAICCRLCFFNDKNPASADDRLLNVKKYMNKAPYKEAFSKIRLSKIEWKLVAVSIAGRRKNPRMLETLSKLQNG